MPRKLLENKEITGHSSQVMDLYFPSVASQEHECKTYIIENNKKKEFSFIKEEMQYQHP